jgi:hypothetical protein
MTSRTPSEPYQRGEADERERGPTLQGDAGHPRRPVPTARQGRDLPAVLHVERWTAMERANDDRPCFPASHRYVEILWTPFLGAISVILLRRLTDAVSYEQAEFEIAELAFVVGARNTPDGKVGKQSSLARAFERLVRFRLAGWMPHDGLAVVTQVPALGQRDLARLPASLGDLHRRLVAELHAQPDVSAKQPSIGGVLDLDDGVEGLDPHSAPITGSASDGPTQTT